MQNCRMITLTMPSPFRRTLILAAAAFLLLSGCAKLKANPDGSDDPGLGANITVDDGVTPGLLAAIYDIADLSSVSGVTLVMANLDARTPLNVTYLARPLDIPARDFSTGLPGLSDLTEWFAMRFTGKIMISTAGQYVFRVLSDDGSRLFVDGTLVVNNDGSHSPTAVDSSALTLSAGAHTIRLEYFQGPRFRLALQFYYKVPGNSSFVIVPAEVLSRP